jgi:hypothetical protein
MRYRFSLVTIVLAALVSVSVAFAEPVSVRHVEGPVHGFLVLHSLEHELLASGDLIQVVHGDRVTTRLIFHFRDGSVHDETAVFSQRGHFRLISDRLVQRGPRFDRPIDVSIDATSGQVTVKYRDERREEKTETEHLGLPDDLANGILITLLKNIDPGGSPAVVSFVAATPKPRLVKLNVTAAGSDPFSIAGSPRTATHYVVKVDLGGVAGIVGPLFGKQPPDSHVWILQGEPPAFVRSEAFLAIGGPVWRTDLESPTWPRPR